MLAFCNQTSFQDVNTDGVYDYFDFQVSLPLLDNENIQSVRLALELHLELSGMYRQSLKTLAIIESASPLPSHAALDFIGDLSYTSRTPFQAYKDSTLYDVSLLNFTEILGTRPYAMTWPQLMRQYAAREGKLFPKMSSYFLLSSNF